MEALVSWFFREKGWLDKESMGLIEFHGQGTGAVALRDIPEGHTLFTIPRSITLSTLTSELPRLIGDASWKPFRLHTGWVGLILCMMWEEAKGDSKWSEYLESLPWTFDTPMFWNEDELRELEGTSVLEKIGKEEAEKDYHEKLLPAVNSRPDLFNPAHLDSHYSLKNYHRMGSLILSRSFQVEKWKGKDEEETNQASPQEDSETQEHYMEVDHNEHVEEETEEVVDEPDAADEDSEEDEGDPSDVAMVPMADMLNARYGSENAKLFYEPTELKMVTTKPIKAGEQIYNTYGDLPNADLLRRYGHIDLIPLPGDPSREGNPADVVEIRADLLVEVVSANQGDEVLKERIDWWLDEGGDDVFFGGTDLTLPDDLVSFSKLLFLSPPDWEKARTKGKPPKPKLDQDSKLQILPFVLTLLEKRLMLYPTTIERDETLLASSSSLPTNLRNALIVRIGEKRILVDCATKYKSLLEEVKAAARSEGYADCRKAVDQKKRKRGKGDTDGNEGKIRKRAGR